MEKQLDLQSDPIIILITCIFFLIFSIIAELFLVIPIIFLFILLINAILTALLMFFLPGYMFLLLFANNSKESLEFSPDIIIQSILTSIGGNFVIFFIFNQFILLSNIVTTILLIFPCILFSFIYFLSINKKKEVRVRRFYLLIEKVCNRLNDYSLPEIFGEDHFLKIESVLILIVVFFSAFIVIMEFNSEKEQYTEFYLLSEDDSSDLKLGFELQSDLIFKVVIICYEGRETSYHFNAQINKTEFTSKNISLKNKEKFEFSITTLILNESKVYFLELFLSKSNPEYSDFNLYLFVFLTPNGNLAGLLNTRHIISVCTSTDHIKQRNNKFVRNTHAN